MVQLENLIIIYYGHCALVIGLQLMYNWIINKENKKLWDSFFSGQWEEHK